MAFKDRCVLNTGGLYDTFDCSCFFRIFRINTVPEPQRERTSFLTCAHNEDSDKSIESSLSA